MYSLVVFLATALTWIFLYAVTTNSNWVVWLFYAFVATLGLYVHYFFVFLLIALHIWVGIYFLRNKDVLWRLIIVDIFVGLLFLPQLEQALARTQAYLGGVAWQASPHILSPLTTLYYLLFVHRSPIWVFPIGIFLMLIILVLTLWEGRRRSKREKRIEVALWLSLVVPIVIVLLISWLVQPIYLERSFAVSSPALVLLLAHGAIAAPRWSPTPYLTTLLFIPFIVTLVVNVVTPDPAKPPIREVSQVISTDLAPGHISLHLQDASLMPATWYTPEVPHILVDVSGAAWTIESTHRLFGSDVAKLQPALIDADRLWLTVMPGFIGPQQKAVFEEIAATYPQLMMEDWGSVQLYLFDLQGGKE